MPRLFFKPTRRGKSQKETSSLSSNPSTHPDNESSSVESSFPSRPQKSSDSPHNFAGTSASQSVSQQADKPEPLSQAASLKQMRRPRKRRKHGRETSADETLSKDTSSPPNPSASPLPTPPPPRPNQPDFRETPVAQTMGLVLWRHLQRIGGRKAKGLLEAGIQLALATVTEDAVEWPQMHSVLSLLTVMLGGRDLAALADHRKREMVLAERSKQELADLDVLEATEVQEELVVLENRLTKMRVEETKQERERIKLRNKQRRTLKIKEDEETRQAREAQEAEKFQRRINLLEEAITRQTKSALYQRQMARRQRIESGLRDEAKQERHRWRQHLRAKRQKRQERRQKRIESEARRLQEVLEASQREEEATRRREESRRRMRLAMGPPVGSMEDRLRGMEASLLLTMSRDELCENDFINQWFSQFLG